MTWAKGQFYEDCVECNTHGENGVDVIPLPRDSAGTQIHIDDFVAVFGRKQCQCVAVCRVHGLTIEKTWQISDHEIELQWQCHLDSGYTCLAKNTIKVFGEEELAKWLADWEANTKESGTVN